MSRHAAETLSIPADELMPFGPGMHKVKAKTPSSPGTLILVSAITPTKAGEGKTTTSIGLADGLRKIGKNSCVALREPSLGPCFGVKGGGTGGGRAQLVPSDRINLHFTGDFHAITAAHNLLAAAIDNHLHHGNALGLDGRRITWPRVLDVNDRALRNLVGGIGGPAHGVPRSMSFDITAASELMAILCLAKDENDLRERIDRTIIGFTAAKEPVYARSLQVTGAMMALLRDAVHPNLVETQEGTPAFVHGGPFANIAHGCNSVIATRTALHYADWVVTEAGFGFDLGAEKFFDIKCRDAGLDPKIVVLVASVRALKLHGGADANNLETPDEDALKGGLVNLEKHLDTANQYGKKVVIAINRFASDSDGEIAAIRDFATKSGSRFAIATHFSDGGEGAVDLAKEVVAACEEEATAFTPMYELNDSIEDKIRKVAQKVYGAEGIELSTVAQRACKQIESLGLANLPICVAKTQSSLSDNPSLLGRPSGFTVSVRNIIPNAGAGFLVVLTGDILRMPGLPKVPQAVHIDLKEGEIQNLR